MKFIYCELIHLSKKKYTHLQSNYIKIIVTVFILHFISLKFNETNAQNIVVLELDSTEIELIISNGWELFYSTSSFDITDFIISDETVFFESRIAHNHSYLYLYDESMVLKKQLKLPEINSYGLGVPVFQSYGNKLIYGEYNERYYFVEGHKFKKKREIISYPKSAGRYVFQGIYKKGIDSNDFIGYMDYDPKSNIQKFELYMVNKEAYRKVFSTSFETQTALAVKPFKLYDYVVNEDKVVVLDAVNHLLFLIVDSSKVISIDIASILNYDLSASSTKGHKIRLLNDFKTGTNYVAVYSERLFELYRIRITDHDIRLVKIKTIDYFSASVQIYDDYIYSLFKSKQDESYSVYRKSIR